MVLKYLSLLLALLSWRGQCALPTQSVIVPGYREWAADTIGKVGYDCVSGVCVRWDGIVNYIYITGKSGRGGQTLALSALGYNGGRWELGRIDVVSTFFSPEVNHTYMFRTAYMPAPDGIQTWAFQATIFGDLITGDMIVAGGWNELNYGNGTAFMWRGGGSQWSLSQTFAPTQFRTMYDGSGNSGHKFGSYIDVDPVSNRKLFIVCQICNYPNGIGEGSAYVYTPSSITAATWSQQQILYPPADNLYKIEFQVVSSYDRHVIIYAHNTHNRNMGGYHIFQQGPGPEGKWSFQQILTTDMDQWGSQVGQIFEDSIYINVQYATAEYYAYGEVLVFESCSEIPGPKGRPRRWSLSQTLRAAQFMLDMNIRDFGWGLWVDGDTMVVSDAAEYETFDPSVRDTLCLDNKCSRFTYFYKRDETKWKWSVQQIFRVLPVNDGSLNANFLAGNNAYTTTTGQVVSWTNSLDWKCIQISLEDHFGDGWGEAKLHMKTPTGIVESMTSTCNTPNPWLYRYCPAVLADGGMYEFYFPQVEIPAYRFEILWRVYVESNEEWFIGNFDTKMRFHFDTPKKSFIPGPMERLLPLNNTCDECPHSEPTPKDPPSAPKQNPGRALKGGLPPTLRPTISPAPTYHIDSVRANWQYIQLDSTLTVDWFQYEHRSANYQIYDVTGEHMLYTGTMCTGVSSQLCWAPLLDDGIYVVRVGGALVKTTHLSTSLFWSFCGETNIPPQTELVVQLKDQMTCSVLSISNRQDKCQVPSIYQAVVNIELYMEGLNVHNFASLTSNEISIIEEAIASVLSISASAVSVTDARGSWVQIQLVTDISLYGFDPKNTGDSYSAVSYIANVINENAAIVTQRIRFGDRVTSTLMSVQSIGVHNSELVDIVMTPNLEGVENEQEFASVEDSTMPVGPNENLVSFEEHFVAISSNVGYVVAFVFGIALVFGALKAVSGTSQRAAPNRQNDSLPCLRDDVAKSSDMAADHLYRPISSENDCKNPPLPMPRGSPAASPVTSSSNPVQKSVPELDNINPTTTTTSSSQRAPIGDLLRPHSTNESRRQKNSEPVQVRSKPSYNNKNISRAPVVTPPAVSPEQGNHQNPPPIHYSDFRKMLEEEDSWANN